MILCYSGVDSVAQFLTVFLIFIFVLVLTYFATRFAGGYKKRMMAGQNIKIMETVSISASKYLQIINVGARYFLIAVTKDNVTYLCELNEEDVEFTENDSKDSFQNIFDKLKKNGQVLHDEEKDH
ncbi:MAG: flagellar biosynthetic protein FliO [Lachnospiraceae bacterium]